MTIEPLGDAALLIHLGERIEVSLNAHALAIAEALRAAALPGVSDVAPAYSSVCVRYDPAALTGSIGAHSPYDAIVARISAIVEKAALPLSPDAVGREGCIEIPVCYGGDCGPDLAEVAGLSGLQANEVIARHSAVEYCVAMLGFAPGFPYLFGLDSTLHTPRRANPRTRVPAGSVAIGGAQTGIYPRELPGGWRIIGRTPLDLFDPARDPPALLTPGQRVRFKRIDAGAFADLSR